MSTHSLATTRPTFYTIFGLWDDHIPESLKTIQFLNAQCGFDVQMVGKKEVLEMIKKDASMAQLYDRIPRKVCRADIARLYLMKNKNGYYVDMDILLKSNINAFLKTHQGSLFLFCEHDNCDPRKMSARENKLHTRRIFNCIFGSTANDTHVKFWDLCISICKTRISYLLSIQEKECSYTWTDSDVLWATGPDVITTAYHTLKHEMDMQVVSRTESDMYFRHYETGTWRNCKDS